MQIAFYSLLFAKFKIFKKTSMESKPIKRNEHIASLSREHHFSLLFGWKIKNGIKFNIEPKRIAKYAIHFWEHNLQVHFQQEEETLFSFCNDELIERALSEHVLIRQTIEQIKSTTNEIDLTTHLAAIAELVTNHVRFEERLLFPHLENILTAEQLKNIGHSLHEMLEEPLQDTYSDEFWVKKA
jgi:iron-sulfur cluster repair protein YtfE (RIC family)